MDAVNKDNNIEELETIKSIPVGLKVWTNFLSRLLGRAAKEKQQIVFKVLKQSIYMYIYR